MREEWQVDVTPFVFIVVDAVEMTERDHLQRGIFRGLDDEGRAMGCQEPLEMTQRPIHVLGRVEHIRADDDIERARIEFLIRRGIVDIEEGILDLWLILELASRALEKEA